MSLEPSDTTPVLIGAAQFTQRQPGPEGLHAVAMLERASRAALADTGAGEAVLKAVDTTLTVAFTIDSARNRARGLPQIENPPRRLSKALGIAPRREICTTTGGNTPQYVVNRMAEEIAGGETKVALLAGAEFLHSYMRLLRAGEDMPGWFEDLPEPEIVWGDPREGTNAHESAHGLNYPANTYPLIEQAIRRERESSVNEHMAAMGRLMSPLSRVAADNPYAWFPVYRSPEEIATPAPENRMVGFPYTKYMNAVIRVDQSAAVLMTSVGTARELGVPREKWVFLHGCADAADIWSVLERPEMHRSPAIRATARRALDMADWRIGDIDYLDIYSCFPSALEVACAELGIPEDDPRGLTVTGGLPYFGGPGNNYTMHAIATMMERLRAKPGSRGLVTANGWYLTKHAVGLYSTDPVTGPWAREDPARLQAELDAGPRLPVTERPEGKGTIESFTVVHTREGVRMGIVIGRTEEGARFVANPPAEEALLLGLEARDPIGRTGSVRPAPDGKTNLFVPDGI
ncbi:MAG: acetyl-CoA acetyltransferase [Alphaproteobacteria bacterium]